MMSITADAMFVVVLVFIACLLDLVMRRIVVRDEHDVYNRCANGPGVCFVGWRVGFVASG